MIVLERQIKRFDVKIRDLQVTDQFPRDATLPSLLQPSAANTVPPLSGVSTPLQSVSVNTTQGGGANVANAAIARLNSTSRTASGTATPSAIHAQSRVNAPAARATARDASTDASKRRRLNNSVAGSTAPALVPENACVDTSLVVALSAA